MNKKQFEIYKTWRTKNYQRDLEEKQEELAQRGVALSSCRAKEEQWLRDEFEADIAKVEAECDEYTQRVSDENRTNLNQRIINIILAVTSIIALSINVVVHHYDTVREEQLNRPYYSIEKIEVEPTSLDNYDYKVVIYVENQGTLPALEAKFMYKFTDSSGWFKSVTPLYLTPSSEGNVWIMMTKAGLQSIDKASSSKRMVVRRTYASLSGRFFCDESQYSSMPVEDKYLLSLEKSYECAEAQP